MSIKQRKDETLHEFISRFNSKAFEVCDLDQAIAIATLMNDPRNS